MGRSSTTSTDKVRTIHGSLENKSHPTLAQVFIDLLSSEEQFKLK